VFIKNTGSDLWIISESSSTFISFMKILSRSGGST
jgi:hypothetical protein